MILRIAGDGLWEESSGHRSKIHGLLQCWKNFALFLRQNYGVWRWSILSRFWRILGFWFLGCGSACHCQFGTDLALVE